LYNILIQFGIPTKLVRIIKMCLNETYNKVHISKNLHNAFRLENESLLQNMLSEMSNKIMKDWNWMEHIISWSVLLMLML